MRKYMNMIVAVVALAVVGCEDEQPKTQDKVPEIEETIKVEVDVQPNHVYVLVKTGTDTLLLQQRYEFKEVDDLSLLKFTVSADLIPAMRMGATPAKKVYDVRIMYHYDVQSQGVRFAEGLTALVASDLKTPLQYHVGLNLRDIPHKPLGVSTKTTGPNEGPIDANRAER